MVAKKKSPAKKGAKKGSASKKFEVVRAPAKDPTIKEIQAQKMSLKALEDQGKFLKELTRRARHGFLKVLYVIYADQGKIDTKKTEYADGRTGKFSFTKYLQVTFDYGAVTSANYTGVLEMIRFHDMPEAIDSCRDIKILELIKSCDPPIQKQLLGDVENLTRDSFKARRAELENSGTEEKKKLIPYLRRMTGFLNLKKKLDLDKLQLVVKGKDRVYLTRLDQLLDVIDQEEVDRILDQKRTQN